MAPGIPKGGSGKFVPQGQTAGPYGNEPSADSPGVAAQPAKPLKP